MIAATLPAAKLLHSVTVTLRTSDILWLPTLSTTSVRERVSKIRRISRIYKRTR